MGNAMEPGFIRQRRGLALDHQSTGRPAAGHLQEAARFEQELARKLLVGRSNMSMLLPQMEKRGLIERRGDARDKRVLRLYLTTEGRRLTEAAMAILEYTPKRGARTVLSKTRGLVSSGTRGCAFCGGACC